MRNLCGIILLLFFVSCSHRSGESTLIGRIPSSSAGGVLSYESDSLSSDLRPGDFYRFLKEAQGRGFEKVVFEPKRNPIIKVAMTEDTSISGDFYLMIGTNFTDIDERIRKGDFDDIFDVAKRMAWLKFRVTINLVASVTDLKNALSNTKPTIIVWTSHGNVESFYDFNQMPVAASIFKNTSPSVYQFHLASCDGLPAMQKKYLPYIPETMKYWAWEGLTYHPSTLKPHFARTDWSPFINYPGNFTNKGLTCSKIGESYRLYDMLKNDYVGTAEQASLEICNYLVANGTQDAVCNKNGEKWDIYSRKNLSVVTGKAFETHYDCHSRVTNIHNGNVCRRIESDGLIHFVNVHSNEVSTETFEDSWKCYDFVHSLSET